MGRFNRFRVAEEIAKYGGPPAPAPKNLDDLGPILARWPIMLVYNPANGDLYWRTTVESPSRDPESITREEALATYRGIQGSSARNMIRIDGFTLMAAKVVWVLHHKTWPTGRLNWRNGDTEDDRIENLELMVDAKIKGRFRVRPVGVAKYYDRWQAYVRFPDGRQTALGVFKTEAEAIAARKAWDDGNDLV